MAEAFIEQYGEIHRIDILLKSQIDDETHRYLRSLNSVEEPPFSYALYSAYKYSCMYIDEYKKVNSEIKGINGKNVVLYGAIVSDDPLPYGRVDIICYRHSTDNIERHPDSKED